MFNARFWIWHKDGFVKITLAPNQEFETKDGGLTDEGFDVTHTRYVNDGNGIFTEYVRHASDCDGRLDQSGEAYCPYELMQAYQSEYTPADVYLPTWLHGMSSQRDYSAEAMNY